AKEQAEIDLLNKYLPEQASDQEIEAVVKEIVAIGATDFGKTMSQAMARLKGKADGKRVGEIVKQAINKQ
ncbi:MAG: GatB/YqeY domain-containing protein, partial [Candidatus Gracilibacteria bacterium]